MEKVLKIRDEKSSILKLSGSLLNTFSVKKTIYWFLGQLEENILIPVF